MPLKIATPEIQAALNAYLAANEEEAHAMSVKTELQDQFRRIAATRGPAHPCNLERSASSGSAGHNGTDFSNRNR